MGLSIYVSVVVLLQLCVCGLAYHPTVYDVELYCGSSIYVSDSIRLKLLRNSWPFSDTCEVTLQANSIYHTNSYISAKFISVGLDSSFGTCDRSRVDIIDSDGNILSESGGVCGYVTPFDQPWESNQQSLKVRLKRLQPGQTGTFDLLATTISYGFCDDTGEFDCDNGKCVSSDVECDGYDNCGDDSDEIEGCMMSAGLIAGISVGVVCGFIIFITVIIVACRRRSYRTVMVGSNMGYGTPVIQSTTVTQQYGAIPPGYSAPPPAYNAPPPAYPGYQTKPAN